MIIRNIILSIILAISVVFAKDSDSTVLHITEEPNLPSSLNYSKFYLDLAKKDNNIDKVIETDIKVKKKLEYLDKVQVSNRPLNIVLNSTMFIYAHPKYPITILFPSGYIITNIHSFGQKDLSWKYDKNIVDVKAGTDLTEQTMMIKYADLKGRKYVANIVVNRFINKDGMLHNIYKIVEPKHLDLKDVLNKYYTKYGNFPTKTTFIKIDGIVYRFIEDEKNGNIVINDKHFFFRYGNE